MVDKISEETAQNLVRKTMETIVIKDYKWVNVSLRTKERGPYVFPVGKSLREGSTEWIVDEFGAMCVDLVLGSEDMDLASLTMAMESRQSVSIQIPGKKVMKQISQGFQYLDKFRFRNKEKVFSFADVIAMLKWVPGFAMIEQTYALNPDDGVYAGVKGEEYLADRALAGYKSPVAAGELLYTKGEMQLAAYMVMLMITKTLNRDVEGQMSTFLINRATAISFTLGVDAATINIKTLYERFDAEELRDLSTSFSYFPRLKSCIFMIVLAGFNPVTQHMRSIFEQSQMTIFSLIHEFMSAEKPTRLHANEGLFDQIQNWIASMNDLESKYGTAWQFYKLIEPNGTITSTKKLAKLGSAALAWKKVTAVNEGKTLTNLKGVVFNAYYEKLASKEIPQDCLTTTSQNYAKRAREMKDFSYHLKINWEMIATLVEEGKWQAGVDF